MSRVYAVSGREFTLNDMRIAKGDKGDKGDRGDRGDKGDKGDKWGDELITLVDDATNAANSAAYNANTTNDIAIDLVDNLTNQTIDFVNDAINNTVISSGFVTIDSFEASATITQRNQALRHAVDGKLYRWAGDLPKTVPVGSTPASTGGFSANAWLEVSDTTLRQDLANPDKGATMVARSSVSVTSVEELAKLSIDKGFLAELNAGSRSGRFLWRGENLSSEVSSDPLQGIYVTPASDPTGASGAWVRQYSDAVSVEWFGAVGDGVSDDTAALQAAFDVGNAHIVELARDKTYLISPKADGTPWPYHGVSIKSNTIFRGNGSTLKAIPVSDSNSTVLLIKDVSNIYICDLNVVGERHGHLGTGGEWGTGLRISKGHNIVIERSSFNDCWGDGIYIGIYKAEETGYDISNITIRDCVFDGNRRQGVSVCTGHNIEISNCIFSNTHGTGPASGIDIEVDVNAEGWLLKNVRILGCTAFGNEGNGMQVASGYSSQKILDISFINCHSYNNLKSGFYTQSATNVKYINCISEGNSLRALNMPYESHQVSIEGCTLSAGDGVESDGININYCVGLVFKGNTVIGGNVNKIDERCVMANVVNNTFKNTAVGLWLASSGPSNLNDNTFMNCETVGLYVHSTSRSFNNPDANDGILRANGNTFIDCGTLEELPQPTDRRRNSSIVINFYARNARFSNTKFVLTDSSKSNKAWVTCGSSDYTIGPDDYHTFSNTTFKSPSKIKLLDYTHPSDPRKVKFFGVARTTPNKSGTWTEYENGTVEVVHTFTGTASFTIPKGAIYTPSTHLVLEDLPITLKGPVQHYIKGGGYPNTFIDVTSPVASSSAFNYYSLGSFEPLEDVRWTLYTRVVGWW